MTKSSQLDRSTAKQSSEATTKQSPDIGLVVQDKFGRFVNSLGDLLLDITDLEVNTMVVAHISGSKFVPEEAYENLYELPLDPEDLSYFQERGMPLAKESTSRYCALRKRLEMGCRSFGKDYGIDHALDPSDKLLDQLIRDPRFLRFLRKLSEMKASLDSDSPTSKSIDIIYAQTILQLDGDIINRFNEKLFEHPNKEVIMKLHTDAVTSGEQQWHGLLGFMVNLVRSMIPSQQDSNSIPFLPNGNGKQQNN